MPDAAIGLAMDARSPFLTRRSMLRNDESTFVIKKVPVARTKTAKGNVKERPREMVMATSKRNSSTVDRKTANRSPKPSNQQKNIMNFRKDLELEIGRGIDSQPPTGELTEKRRTFLSGLWRQIFFFFCR